MAFNKGITEREITNKRVHINNKENELCESNLAIIVNLNLRDTAQSCTEKINP